MSFTVDDFHDLIRLLEQQPSWRADLRRFVLTEELLALPEQLARFQAQTDRRFQELAEAQQRTDERLEKLAEQTDRRFQELAEAQQRTDEQLKELTKQVETIAAQQVNLTKTLSSLTDEIGELKGDMLEIRFRESAPAYLSRLVRRLQVFSTAQLVSLLDDAVEQGQLSQDEADDIVLADTVGQGKRRADSANVYVVVEVSSVVDPHDVERAVRRAALLAKIGMPAQPVVAGRRATSEATRQARELHVWQLTDGKIARAK